MTTTTTADSDPTTPPRKRHWARRVLITLAALVVLLVASVILYIKLAPVPAPLALQATPTSAPTDPLEGQWDVTTGSTAGFRIQQTVLFATNDVVQRTEAVTGTVTITGTQATEATEATEATFRIDLTTLNTNGTPTPQLAISLDTKHHPNATITLTEPLDLDPAITSGTTITTTAPAQLSLRGQTHPTTVTITARQDGDTLQVTGSLPVTFADWDIPNPDDYGPLGSLADHGTAEFRLNLERHLS
jgi:hypothetical protein